MSEEKFEFHFHAPVGQNIAKVENMTVHMDKEGKIQVMNADNLELPADKPSTIPTCRYIDFDKLAQNGIYTPEQFTTMLRQACEQDAKALAAFLTKYFKMGYLDFHGDSKKKIYEHLKECFPGTIKYSYPNFTQYFN